MEVREDNMQDNQVGSMSSDTEGETMLDKTFVRCRTIRSGTIFSTNAASLKAWLQVMHLWAGERSADEMSQKTNVSLKIVKQLLWQIRRICCLALSPVPSIKIGHLTTRYVQAECFALSDADFAPCPASKRSNFPKKIFVIVLVDSTSQIGYMESTETSAPDYLAQVAERHTMESLCWGTLSFLKKKLGNDHLNDHATTYWNRVRSNLKRQRIDMEDLEDYLEKFMWRERWGKNRKEAFDNILSTIAKWYDPVTAGRGVE